MISNENIDHLRKLIETDEADPSEQHRADMNNAAGAFLDVLLDSIVSLQKASDHWEGQASSISQAALKSYSKMERMRDLLIMCKPFLHGSVSVRERGYEFLRSGDQVRDQIDSILYE